LGIAARKDTHPYALALSDHQGNISWVAPNYEVRGNVLVSWDMFAGEESKDEKDVVFRQLIEVTRRLSRWRLPIALTTWLLGTTEDISTIHREVGEALGITKRSLTVVDLIAGRGITWDAAHGVMTEIEPALPQSAP